MRRLMHLCAALAVVVAGAPVRVEAEAPACIAQVQTVSGPVCGALGATDPIGAPGPAIAVASYKGLPYAQPPVGALRWRPPQQPPAPWTAPRQAAAFGSACSQPGYPQGSIGSEDCLFLNVWTPQTDPAAREKRPVMVFLHGGAFTNGAGSDSYYEGTNLAGRGDVVVVTINYRLGALGFLAAPRSRSGRAFEIDGNFAVLDQQASLRWVRDNIAAFGGDPAKVTLFGESAGAMSVGLHLYSMPESRALFRAAIMESNPLGFFYPVLGPQTDHIWAAFHGALCQVVNGTKDTVPCTPAQLKALDGRAMRAATPQQVAAAENRYELSESFLERLMESAGMSEAMPWMPIVDGDVVRSQPFHGYARGMPEKPFIFGVNRDEGVLFATWANNSSAAPPTPPQLTDKAYAEATVGMFGPIYGPRARQLSGDPAGPRNPYSAQAQRGAAPAYFKPGAAAAVSNVLNDMAFHCANLISVRRNEPERTFGYLFAQPPFPRQQTPGLGLGCTSQAGNVCHSAELPYVFDNLRAVTPPDQSPPAINIALAARMSTAWAVFAHTLAPPPGWAPYATANGLEVFGTGKVPADLYAAANCAFWTKVPQFEETGRTPFMLPSSPRPPSN